MAGKWMSVESVPPDGTGMLCVTMPGVKGPGSAGSVAALGFIRLPLGAIAYKLWGEP